MKSDYVFAFYGSFLQVCKTKKKKKKKKENLKKTSNFLKAYISGMTGVIYLRSGVYFLLICWRLDSEFGLVWSGDHGATNARKIVLCSSC